jgi:aladin
LERPQRLVSFVLSDESGKPIRVGGIIRNIALDPNGERLVVSFEPPPSTRSPTAGASTVGSELIAVFMVRLSNWLGGQRPLLANGFIRGPPAANYRPDTALQITRHPHAVSISFAPHFDRGSLLAIAWDHGKITFVPFFYMSSNRRLLEERMDYRLPEW